MASGYSYQLGNLVRLNSITKARVMDVRLIIGSFGIEPIREGSYVPDLVIFLNPSECLSAIRECTLKNIPTVGVVDTDTDPRLVTYPIPANMEVSREYSRQQGVQG